MHINVFGTNYTKMFFFFKDIFLKVHLFIPVGFTADQEPIPGNAVQGVKIHPGQEANPTLFHNPGEVKHNQFTPFWLVSGSWEETREPQMASGKTRGPGAI